MILEHLTNKDKRKDEREEERNIIKKTKGGWTIRMLQTYYILLWCTLVPKRRLGLRNWMEYFSSAWTNSRKFGTKMVLHRN